MTTYRTNDKMIPLQRIIVAATAIDDIYTIRRLYPKDIDEKEVKKMHDSLIEFLEDIIADYNDDNITTLYKKPLSEDFDSQGLMKLLKIMALKHNDIIITDNQIELDSITAVFKKSINEAPEPIKEIISRINDIKIYNCMIPHPYEEPEYGEKKRIVQILRDYWGFCISIINDMKNSEIYCPVRPLTPLIINLKRRCLLCFERICEKEESKNIIESFTYLMEIVVSDEPYILQIEEEWTNGTINMITLFIEEAWMENRVKKYGLTEPERCFMESANDTISGYIIKRKKHWNALLEAEKGSAKMCPISDELAMKCHPNITKTLIPRMETAYKSGDFANVLHVAASIIETLSKDVIGNKQLENQTFGSYFGSYRKNQNCPKK